MTDPDGRAGGRAPITDFEPSPAVRARTALFEAGFELAGVKLQRFAERLFQVADASPGTPREDLIRCAVQDIDGGALAVVAEEPELCDRTLDRPATTVNDAAYRALHAVGLALLHAHGRP
jgi:hypothetical protein